METEKGSSREEELKEAQKMAAENAETETGSYEYAHELEMTIWRLGETIKRLEEQIIDHKHSDAANREAAYHRGFAYNPYFYDYKRKIALKELILKSKTELEAELGEELKNAEWKPAPAEDKAEDGDAAPAEPTPEKPE